MQYLRVIETGRLEPLTEHESKQRSNVRGENELLQRARFKVGPDGQPALEPVLGPDGMPTGKVQEVLDDTGLPSALITDNHLVHGPGHTTLLDSPFARRNKALVRAVLAHLKSHEDQWAFATINRPGLLEMIGVPLQQAALMQQAQQAMLAAAQPGVAPPAGKPADGGKASGGANVMLGAQGPGSPAELPELPSLPPGAAMATGVNPAAPGPGGAQ